MPGPQVKVEGLRELRSTMRKAGMDLSDLKAAMTEVAAIVSNAARTQAPHRSGQLAASLKGSRAVGQAQIRSSLVYGNPIHWGHPARNIEPQPFITEAGRATESQWLQVLLDEIDRALAQVRGA